jgi:hypothetical protein
MAKRDFPKFDTAEVLVVAQAIFRLEGNKINRGDFDFVAKFQQVSSKERIVAHFNNTKLIEVTDDDRDVAGAIASHIQQRVIMDTLMQKEISNFITDINTIVSREHIHQFDLGRVVWAPKLYADMVQQSTNQEDIAQYAISSVYVGKVKEKLELTFFPISIKFNREYNCFRHLGHDGQGNLIGFLNKNKIETGRCIQGRVKSHSISQYNNNGKVTYLNYVRVLA